MTIDTSNPFTALPGLLLPWYRANARAMPWRETTQPYRVWLSEIMLQQTRVEAVIPYFNRFVAALPDIPALAAADPGLVLKLWEGLGYYSRARNLQRAARVIMEAHGGVFPRDHGDIRKLPGIGDYTAGAIASICFEAPTPAVDGNVLRVMSRLLASAEPVDDPRVKKQITRLLASIYPPTGRGDFTQSLMELGATICLPKAAPKCLLCPAADICRANQSQAQADYPVKSPKKARRVEERTAFALFHGKTLALEQRPDAGLLAGLWQLPNVEGFLTEAEAVALAARWGLQPLAVTDIRRHTHAFTHVEWRLLCYFIDCGRTVPAFAWAEQNEVEGRYAIPTPFRKLLKLHSRSGF